MRKYFLALVLFTITIGTASAEFDRHITLEKLPLAARKFINTHFPEASITFAKSDNGVWNPEYEVRLNDGTKIEFDKKGNWKDIECKHASIPTALIPTAIAEYVKKHHQQSKIIKIERNRHGYEISLSNELEITFDKKFNIIDIDD
jgi:uncharacterized protein YuzE